MSLIDKYTYLLFAVALVCGAIIGLVAGMWLFSADWRDEIKKDWNS